MSQKRHTMHGRDHLPGGADPIGSGANIDLGRYVIAAVPLYRNLWVGNHVPISSGPDAKTTIACPLITTVGPAPLSKKFHDHSIVPVWTTTSDYGANLGIHFQAFVPNVQCTGVQFWAAGGEGGEVKLWLHPTGEELASGAGTVAYGWNEIYFDTPYILDSSLTAFYVVGTTFGDRPLSPVASAPYYAGDVAGTTSPNPYRRHLPPAAGMPDSPTGVEYYIGPIVDYTPPDGDPRIVATASHGTEEGVWIHRTEKGDNVIDIFWSAADAIVAADVFVMGPDPGGTQPCESEHYKLLGNCIVEET